MIEEAQNLHHRVDPVLGPSPGFPPVRVRVKGGEIKVRPVRPIPKTAETEARPVRPILKAAETEARLVHPIPKTAETKTLLCAIFRRQPRRNTPGTFIGVKDLVCPFYHVRKAHNLAHQRDSGFQEAVEIVHSAESRRTEKDLRAFRLGHHAYHLGPAEFFPDKPV